jgi:hypothetical protein
MTTENTNETDFPPLFIQARNLMEQAIASGTGVLNGKPLIASMEKAKARLDICAACEFFNKDRCSKCGCFMNKKAHLDAAQCPMNKWGDLQKLVAYLPVSEGSVSIDTFPLEERETILEIANHAAGAGNTFYHNNTPYKSKKNGDGSINIFLYKPELYRAPQPQRTITSDFTPEELTRFKELVQVSKNAEDKVFSFKEKNYRVTVDGNKISVGVVDNTNIST